MKRILFAVGLLLAVVALLAGCGEDGSTGIPEIDSIRSSKQTTVGNKTTTEPTTTKKEPSTTKEKSPNTGINTSSAEVTTAKPTTTTPAEEITTAPPIFYTVTFNSNGGSEISSQRVKKDGKASRPTDPEKAGYTFAGWTYQGEEWSFLQYPVTENMTLKATWTPITYSITYDPGDGVIRQWGTYTIETANFSFPNATKTGYDFLGWTWAGQNQPKTNVLIAKGSYGDKFYTAKWKSTTYTITYDLAGGTMEENPNPTEYTIESADITFTGTPTRVGYVFAGWKTNNYKTTIPSGSYGNKTVTAQWNAIFCVSSNAEGNTITGLTSTGKTFTQIEIPSEIDGIAITNIGGSAFKGCSGLTSVTIPNGVTSIDDYAFFGCSGLTSITIPNSVTSIGDDAFNGCSSLTSINIPNSVTSIGNYVFMGCSSLTSINIPNSVMSIGNYAFKGCNSLNCNKYNNALYLGNETNPYLVLVKAENTSITSCTVSEQTKYIGSSAFSGCGSLKTITIPNSVTFIGKYAFESCSSLTSATFINVNGWTIDWGMGIVIRTNMTVTDAATNAKNLASYYVGYYWEVKGE